MNAPTPCPDLPLGALIDHVGGFAKVFAASAKKEVGELTSQPPDPRADNLEPGWRARIATDLSALADAWDAPDAWDGMTQAGGQEVPGAMAGRIALDELVVHGWDIAQATGQPFDCDEPTLAEVESTVQQVRDGNDGDMPGLFGPVVAVAYDADGPRQGPRPHRPRSRLVTIILMPEADLRRECQSLHQRDRPGRDPAPT